jgi:radical SAM superfamily enzyme YgiQ (UPF0313 family)
MFKKKNIKVGTFNIMGLPGESLKSLVETFKINADINPEFSQISIYYPYKNTLFYDKVKNMLKDENLVYKTYFERSLIADKFLIPNFYFYYDNFLSFVELYKKFRSPFLRKIIDFCIIYGLYPKNKITSLKSDIFRIIF